MENEKKTGRPTKYNSEQHPAQAMKYALLGLTDKQIAGALEIAESTLNEWKNKYESFSESLRNGKDIADANVASTLYKRALGHKEKRQVPIKIKVYDENDRQIEKVEIVEVEDYYSPEVSAQIFWLKNRQGGIWKDRRDTDLTSGGKPIAPSITMLSASDLTEEQINNLLGGGNVDNADTGEVSEGV